MNDKTAVAIFGYAGDQQQVDDLMPMYMHHECPLIFCSPEDHPFIKFRDFFTPESYPYQNIANAKCVNWIDAGKRAYIGQDSLDRQWLQMKACLELGFEYYLFNDSDSFVLPAKLPDYLYENPDTVFSNEVTDFRAPGKTWKDASGTTTWPADYHDGFPLIAMQPPYFLSRASLEKLVEVGKDIKACPITPFIDWYWVQLCVKAGVKHAPFSHGASCETVTPNGIAVMSQCIRERGAEFIHSVKTGDVMRKLVALHEARNAK